ncbi:hypothetical protein CANARDRAFT_27402 [[Candida] arabinofermentans NRRL YB-2248]|uniref:Uncharacterized protein n=1 Tax=[Candida] arabinofermentans NRRL YB-2248 TaxID=983967 RepID=A0A1E4T309_9ASCO|nr:hypothetical protein CANARDRAFT_27402 [[Candida] arabinofermentans NRRL YB-2248]
MFSEISMQNDDFELLRTSKPIYNLDPKTIHIQILRIQHLINYSTIKIFSKDSEFFRMFWRIDEIPERSQFFYTHFPKVPTNYESDHHVSNYGSFLNHFYLGRWLPDTLNKLIFPFFEIQGTTDRKLSCKGMPTLNECRLCDKWKGVGVWNRNGEWVCVYQDAMNGKESQLKKGDIKKFTKQFAFSESDELGPKYFLKFSDYNAWKRSVNLKIEQLEAKAINCCIFEDLKDVEDSLKRIEDLKRVQSGKIDSEFVVSVQG